MLPLKGSGDGEGAEKGTDLRGLTLDDYRALSPTFDADVLQMLNTTQSLNARSTVGAPSPSNVATQLEKWRHLLAIQS